MPDTTEPTVRIAVDAMGGDHAPAEVVRGALAFARASGPEEATVILVGDEAQVRAELGAQDGAWEASGQIAVRHAPDVIAMDDHPTEAFRARPDASLVVCNRMVKDGEAEAAFSAGNTGAMMIAANFVLERIAGIQRPAIATFFPNEQGGSVVLVDAGANVDCRPKHLEHFALLGAVYAERVLGVANPRVGMLSVGEEEGKGNELTREAARLLSDRASALNFVGNVESNHIFEGRVDVAVCDGFVGNVLLKGVEGAGRLALSLLQAARDAAPDAAARAALDEGIRRVKQRLDYAEFGGAPLLGVNGVAFIAHGRSDGRAFETGIRQAAAAARSGYVDAVRAAITGMKG